MTIRVGLADDQMAVRLGFRMLLELDDQLTVVGEATDGAEAVALAQRMRPDVLLLDIRMPVLDGVEAARQITQDAHLAAVRVVMLTTFDDEDLVADSLAAGASGFLLKDLDGDELRAAVRTVHAGHSLLAPAVTQQVVERSLRGRVPGPDATAALAPLTDREREVLALVGRGMSNEEIGRRLHLSPLTAKTHVSNILTKLTARDRVQLVITAYETGLVP